LSEYLSAAKTAGIRVFSPAAAQFIKTAPPSQYEGTVLSYPYLIVSVFHTLRQTPFKRTHMSDILN